MDAKARAELRRRLILHRIALDDPNSASVLQRGAERVAPAGAGLGWRETIESQGHGADLAELRAVIDEAEERGGALVRRLVFNHILSERTGGTNRELCDEITATLEGFKSLGVEEQRERVAEAVGPVVEQLRELEYRIAGCFPSPPEEPYVLVSVTKLKGLVVDIKRTIAALEMVVGKGSGQ